MSDNECSICMNSLLETGDCTTTNCKHCFHTDCLNRWYMSTSNKGCLLFTCPICRASVNSLILNRGLNTDEDGNVDCFNCTGCRNCKNCVNCENCEDCS